jgi:hypothetical protein
MSTNTDSNCVMFTEEEKRRRGEEEKRSGT